MLGNLIDEAVRNTQDQQTIGIPVGPDTSDFDFRAIRSSYRSSVAFGESRLVSLRFVDDCYPYFATRSEAESALAELHRIAGYFAVEINPAKTIAIKDLPESIQAGWKTGIAGPSLLGLEYERPDLLALFSSAFDNAAKYPGNNVLKFAVKQSTAHTVSGDNWELFESFLLLGESRVRAEPSRYSCSDSRQVQEP